MIARRLRYETSDETVVIGEDGLLALAQNLVVVGEAGIGKSELTRSLEALGCRRVTARQLINHPDPSVLVAGSAMLAIDALDEVSAAGRGEAVDRVLQALGHAGLPHFVLTCRAADWRSATGREAIREQYGAEPLELELLPFSDEDARAVLAEKLGAERGATVFERFAARNLGGLLGNPQTLLMLAEVEDGGQHPETTAELFAAYVDLARVEHSEMRPDPALHALDADAALDALGAGFAALILTGSEAVTLPHKPASAGSLPIADVAALPGANALAVVLQSRLASPAAKGSVTYLHRRIGEYLGARWLARQADTPRKRRRLLKQFHAPGLVPAALRGLHAWLAQDVALAEAVIAADPMGVIEYGDADGLTVAQGRIMLAALEELARRNPRFRNWGVYSARGIAREELLPELRRLITAPETPFGLRLLVIEQVNGAEVAPALAADLHALLLDGEEAYAIREAAADVLVEIDASANWGSVLQTLHSFGDEDALRLALVIADRLGYVPLADDLLANLLLAQTQIESNTVGLLYRVERNLPNDRLDAVLDRLGAGALALGDRHTRPGNAELTDLAYHLIARRVALGAVAPERLWSWLEPFDAGAGYERESREQLTAALLADDPLRRAIQRHVMLELPGDKTLWMRGWRLNERSPGLGLSADDALCLLAEMAPPRDDDSEAIERWRDLVQLAPRGSNEHAQFLQEVRSLTRGHGEFAAWLGAFASPGVPEWKIEQERKAAERRATRERNWQAHRAELAPSIEALRAGEFGLLVNPATAYLNMYQDIGDGLPAHERVEQWLGADLAEAAHAGFEAFLRREPARPTATDLAESHADGKQWPAARIIVAALAERLRTGRGFIDLSDERVIAGWYEVRHTRVDDHASIGGLLETLEAEVRRRGLWEAAQRGWIEPQLDHRRAHTDGLYELMRSEDDRGLAARLAAEWLERYPEMPSATETELLDCLIRAGATDTLVGILHARLAADGLEDERRRNWDAIGVLVDFAATATRLEAAGLEPALLWHLRNRLGGGRWRDGARVALTPAQLAWIVRSYRTSWPVASMPTGVKSGDTNDWDASEYLFDLIRRLGEDASDDASRALAALRAQTPDGYSEYLLTVTAEHERKRAEASYAPPSLAAIAALVRDKAPADAAGLQSVVVEELAQLAGRLKRGGDPDDIRDGFFVNGRAKTEPLCCNHLRVLLRGQMDFEIQLRPEGHLAADKAVDIEATLGPSLMVPIEVKGQWHKDLWTAADTQLARLYSNDWRADRRGIYVVLWFGSAAKPLKAPPEGIAPPTGPDELRRALIDASPAARSGLVEVVVLDLSATSGS